jgi:hypothetical protein
MGAGLASSAFVEQRLADGAAERTQLKRAGVVFERALRRHQLGIGALPFRIAGNTAPQISQGTRLRNRYYYY